MVVLRKAVLPSLWASKITADPSDACTSMKLAVLGTFSRKYVIPSGSRSWRYRIKFTQEMNGIDVGEFQPGTEPADEKA